MKRSTVTLPNYMIGEDVYRKAGAILQKHGKTAVVVGGKTAMEKAADEIIESLKAAMVAAMERVTTPERVRAVEKESIAERRLSVEKYKGTKQIFEGWTYYVNLGRVMFLEGCDEGAARCFHPDHGLYCAWWSRWARVATFKKEFESGAMRY